MYLDYIGGLRGPGFRVSALANKSKDLSNSLVCFSISYYAFCICTMTADMRISISISMKWYWCMSVIAILVLVTDMLCNYSCSAMFDKTTASGDKSVWLERSLS